MDQPRRVCVYCGSSKGNNPAYAQQGKELGRKLAKRHYGVVYGGGSVGIMNEVADGALSRGGQVHGVIPEHLNNREHAHSNLTGLHITDTMHERKALMAELSDAFITLPGGFGTLEELMEAITWSQLGLHDKVVILFNIDGYFNLLVEFIDQAVADGFISSSSRHNLKVAESVEDCLSLLPFKS